LPRDSPNRTSCHCEETSDGEAILRFSTTPLSFVLNLILSEGPGSFEEIDNNTQSYQAGKSILAEIAEHSDQIRHYPAAQRSYTAEQNFDDNTKSDQQQRDLDELGNPFVYLFVVYFLATCLPGTCLFFVCAFGIIHFSPPISAIMNCKNNET
jgi:hypothetical protein